MEINKIQKSRDIRFGKLNEIKVLEILNKYNNNIKKYKYNYSTFDFYLRDENKKKIIEYELKSRNIKYMQYPTIICGKNKFEYAKKRLLKGIKPIFLFYFLDGLYYWELKDIDKQKNEFSFGKICNKKRNDKKIDDGLFIKMEYLKKYI